MHDKPQNKPEFDRAAPPVHPLKRLSAAEFAALGAQSVVYARRISAAELVTLLPGTDMDSEAGDFHLLISADGSPILVTDSAEALSEWLDDKPFDLAVLH